MTIQLMLFSKILQCSSLLFSQSDNCNCLSGRKASSWQLYSRTFQCISMPFLLFSSFLSLSWLDLHLEICHSLNFAVVCQKKSLRREIRSWVCWILHGCADPSSPPSCLLITLNFICELRSRLLGKPKVVRRPYKIVPTTTTTTTTTTTITLE